MQRCVNFLEYEEGTEIEGVIVTSAESLREWYRWDSKAPYNRNTLATLFGASSHVVLLLNPACGILQPSEDKTHLEVKDEAYMHKLRVSAPVH